METEKIIERRIIDADISRVAIHKTYEKSWANFPDNFEHGHPDEMSIDEKYKFLFYRARIVGIRLDDAERYIKTLYTIIIALVILCVILFIR